MVQGFTGARRGAGTARGPGGLTAYDLARRGGYTGTAAEYAALLARPDGNAMGIANTPTLLASLSTVVQVTMWPAMADLGYAPSAVVMGAANVLSSLRVTAVAVVSPTQMNVTVQNMGVMSLTGQILATAVR